MKLGPHFVITSNVNNILFLLSHQPNDIHVRLLLLGTDLTVVQTHNPSNKFQNQIEPRDLIKQTRSLLQTLFFYALFHLELVNIRKIFVDPHAGEIGASGPPGLLVRRGYWTSAKVFFSAKT